MEDIFYIKRTINLFNRLSVGVYLPLEIGDDVVGELGLEVGEPGVTTSTADTKLQKF